MADALIRSKLRIPATRPELVARPRLMSRVAEGLAGPLTLISAPAGFGKTTLVAAGAAACGTPVGWLSLEPRDNQEGRFLRYLAAALQSARASIGGEAAELLSSPQPAPAESVLTSLLNDLDAADTDLVLVLDDYHAITNQAVHAAVAFLLEHRPPALHLVIATRSDPPLPIARLRARGQLVELRAADLRFTSDEATAFLNATMGLNLSAEQAAVLAERTEGWIAGLQMAALSISAHSERRDRSDVARFIDAFSGTHRFVLDYLLEEVLAGQPQDVQDFLLSTSILDRMCAPLCDAILTGEETEGSGLRKISDSTGMLESLERGNVFLVPLDDNRTWYRYHHLFANLLRVRLDHAHPGLATRLHARAAEWFEAQGLAVDAINHALAGGAREQAARLVEENTASLLARGELAALMGWIDALPAELRQSRPWLCIHQAHALAFAGRTAEAESLLAQAEPTLAGARDSGTDEARALAGAIAALRAMLAVMGGRDDAGAVALALQARELLGPERTWDRAWHRATAAWALGYAERSLGHLDAAQAAFEEQIALARSIGNVWTLVSGLMDLAMVLRTRGQLAQARARLEEALQEAGRQGARSLGYIARMEAGLAGVLYEQNELEGARRLLDDAVAHVRQWPNPNHLAYAFSLLARVQRAQGDVRGAAASVVEAAEVMKSAPLTRLVRRMVEADLVRLCYLWPEAEPDQSRRGTLAASALAAEAAAIVKQWQGEIGPNGASAGDESSEAAALVLARIHLANNQPGPALGILQPASQGALAAGWIPSATEAFVLTARALADGAAQGMAGAGQGAALDALGRALELAEPGGFVRVFLSEGRPMQRILAQWLAHAGGSRLRDFAATVLAAFDKEPGLAGRRETAAPAGDLPEPLSPRELEVLHLLAQGLSNQEIAAQLIVAPGTVKAQTASIYRKLDVGNRTQAVARGRELGLIP